MYMYMYMYIYVYVCMYKKRNYMIIFVPRKKEKKILPYCLVF